MSESNTVCAYCNKLIYKKPYELNKRNSKRFFCDRKCRGLFYRTSVEIHCAQCGKVKYIQPHRLKKTKVFFCDHICKGQYTCGYQSGIRDVNYKDSFNFNCQVCGKCFYADSYRINKSDNMFCSRYCFHLWYKGQNHTHWKMDRSKLISPIRRTIMSFDWYIRWRDLIYQRDDYQCRLCGNNQQINAHHIMPFAKIVDDLSKDEIDSLLINEKIPSILLNINNGITLCNKCHQYTYNRELEYRHLCYALLK